LTEITVSTANATASHRCGREGGATDRELLRTGNQTIDLLGSRRITLEDGLCLSGRHGYGIERPNARGWLYRV
jgi:hypothetical protein